MTLTRSQFDTACKALAQHKHGWTWIEHSPGFGYMYRTTPLPKRSTTPTRGVSESDDGDPAAALPSPDHLICHQSVAFSPTFQVPTFYFSVCDSAGSPVGLSEIVHTSLLRKHALDGMEVTAFSIGDPASNFPLLSFGDHPSLDTPCWYLHPCETGPAVEEMLAAREARLEDTARDVAWLDAWFVVLSGVVDVVG